MYHINVNVNLVVGNVIQIRSGITTNVNASAKNIKYVKNMLNSAACSCENGKYLSSIVNDLGIMCDEIIDLEAKKQKQLQQTLMKKMQSVKENIYIFYLRFY